MKAKTEILCFALLLSMLGAINHYMGDRVFFVATFFAVLWFCIAMVLLYRPPGIPEFVSHENDPDEQYVVRRDVMPRLPLLERVRWSLCAACGSCLVIWLTLSMMVM